MRPKRLYKTKKNKYYYIVGKKRKFIKNTSGLSQNQVVKININNVPNEGKRVKRRRKKVQVKYSKEIAPNMKQVSSTIPYFIYQEKKEFPTLEQYVKRNNQPQIEDVKKSTSKPNENNLQITDYNRIKHLIQDTSDATVNKLAGLYLTLTPGQYRPKPLKLPIPEVPLSRGIAGSTDAELLEDLDELIGFPNTKEEAIGIEEGKIEVEKPERLIKTRIDDIVKDLLQDKFDASDYANRSNSMTARANILRELREKHPSSADTTFSITNGKKFDTELKQFYRSINQSGKGASLKEGLYNSEIEQFMKRKLKNFIPVIASDETKNLVNMVKEGEKNFGFIVNTNPSTSDGSGNDGFKSGHWRAVYFNNLDDFTSAEYFDPLAEGNPEPELLETMKKIAKKMNSEKYSLVKVNNLKRQDDGTATCGWHSMKFLDDRFNNVPWDEATGYNDYIKKQRLDDSIDGEKDIKKYFSKYKSYI